MKKKFLPLLCMFVGLDATYFPDNRYFPWLNPPIDRTLKPYSGIRPSLFFVTGNHAFGSGSKEHRGIPEIFGVYDEKAMSNDLIALGYQTPLLGQWQIFRAIPWNVKQKIEGQGIYIAGEHPIYKSLSFGYTLGFMHLFSNQSFSLSPMTIKEMSLSPTQIAEIDQDRRDMFETLGLVSSQWSKSGLLDVALYLRCGKTWEYQAKCRQVTLSLLGGVILPASDPRQPNNTSAVAFDGNGSFGFFVGTDNLFELKEDMKVGILLQAGSRLKQTVTERLTINEKNYLFGALEGAVSIDPGATVSIRPYGILGNIRDGFDIYGQYSATIHAGDVWTDARQNITVPSNLNGMFKKTEWFSEYVSLTLLYDSGKVVKTDEIRPALQVSWDIPVHILGSEEVSKTNRISVGIEVSF